MHEDIFVLVPFKKFSNLTLHEMSNQLKHFYKMNSDEQQDAYMTQKKNIKGQAKYTDRTSRSQLRDINRLKSPDLSEKAKMAKTMDNFGSRKITQKGTKELSK